jgi:hypothetical protein
MDCGDICPYYTSKRYKDWVLEDLPAKTSTASVASATKSATASNVQQVIHDLLPDPD